MAKFLSASLARADGTSAARIQVRGTLSDRDRLVPIQLELTCLWERSFAAVGERGLYRVTLVRPDGSRLPGSVARFHLVDDEAATPTKMSMSGLPVRGAGTYHLAVELGDGTTWSEVARLPIDIQCREARFNVE